ncbi:MAG: hypothetical protein IKM31_01840 [Oscillospiraceae bacterium]|nr:hypothetical protein [Oscillospiraceae bacterium]
MRKLCFAFCLVFLLCCSCSHGTAKEDSKSKIIGYWTSSDMQASVSFDDRNTIVVNDKYIGEYSIFDEGKVAINVDTDTFDDYYDVSMSATYEIEGGILHLYDVENHELYTFYSKDYLPNVINEKYQIKFNESETEYHHLYPFSYADEWEVNLEGTDMEGLIDRETLVKELEEAVELAEKEIISLYVDSMIAGDNAFSYSCSRASFTWDGDATIVCYEVNVHNKLKSENDNCYWIDPNGENIYVDHPEGGTTLWDGTIEGNSIMKRI